MLTRRTLRLLVQALQLPPGGVHVSRAALSALTAGKPEIPTACIMCAMGLSLAFSWQRNSGILCCPQPVHYWQSLHKSGL